MTVKSAGGALTINVTRDRQGDPWIEANGYNGCFRDDAIEALIAELANAIGKTATLEQADTPLPTVPGIYVSKTLAGDGDLHIAKIYKLKGDHWTDAEGGDVDIKYVQRLADLNGLVRLVPEEES